MKAPGSRSAIRTGPSSPSSSSPGPPALGAEGEPVGGVLDVAAGDDGAGRVLAGRADPQARVRHVGTRRHRARRRAQGRPVDVHRARLRRHDFTYGWPSALGALTLPTSPATAMIVAT